jgi:hypothetical protein
MEEEIRAAIVPPVTYKRIPGYCLLMVIAKDGTIRFHSEVENHNWSELVTTTVALEQSSRYGILYTIMNTQDHIADSMFIDLYKKVKEHMPWIKVMPAPYAADIPQGLDLFTKAWLHGKFVMPPKESTLFKHLRISTDALPDEESYAFHALRFILGGLSVQPKIDLATIQESRDHWVRAQDRNMLTGIDRVAWDELEALRKENQRERED